jgi:hypothetical protein
MHLLLDETNNGAAKITEHQTITEQQKQEADDN